MNRNQRVFSGALIFSILVLFLGSAPLVQSYFALEQEVEEAGSSHQEGPVPSSNLILGTVATEPGNNVSIPLYYQPAAGSETRSVHLEVEFVSNSVKFMRAEKGVASEQQDFDLAVEAEELPPDENDVQRTRIKLDATVLDSDSAKVLPRGLWAFLHFEVPPDAKPFSISLNPVSVSGRGPSEDPVAVAAEAGKVIVAVPDQPLVGCFFFTH